MARRKKKRKPSRWGKTYHQRTGNKQDFLADLPRVEEMAVGFGLNLTYTNVDTVHAVFRRPGESGWGVLQFWPSTGKWVAHEARQKGKVDHWLDLADVLGGLLVDAGPVDHLRAIQFQGRA